MRRLRKMLTDLGEEFKAGKIEEDNYSQLANLLEDTLELYEGRLGETDAIICPINGHGVILAFEKYSGGIFSDFDVAQTLNTAGYRTNGSFGSNPFGKDTITPMLQSRFYVGQTSYQGKKKGAQKEYIQGRHEPIISQELFDKCQEVRKKRAGDWSRGSSNQIFVYPLSSILICADCGSVWHGWHLREDRRYRDPAKARDVSCPSHTKSVLADTIEQSAADQLIKFDLPTDWRERVLELLARDNPNYAQLKKQHSSLQGRLDRLRLLFIEGDITETEYKQMKLEIQGQLGMLPLPIQGRIIDLERAADLLGNIRDIWGQATLEEREVWFKLMFNKVYVKDGAIKAIEPTPVMSALSDTRSGSDGI
jgi:hypothetical protein